MNARFLVIFITAAALIACGTHDEHADHAPADAHAEHDHAGHDHAGQRPAPAASPVTNGAAPEQLYTCPMHPQVVRMTPGRCPICGMDLVPVRAAQHDATHVQIPPGVQQTMNVRTAVVDRGRMWRPIDAPARVDYDASRLVRIHPRVEGWIEDVGVNAVGEAVTDGQMLFSLYSPRLVNAQEELLLALRRGDDGATRAARDNLRALGVQDTVIAEVERERRARRALPWRADADGVVRELGIRRGMTVGPGDTLLELADLSAVWLTAEVFDRNAAWLRVGQPAEVTLSYAPGTKLDAEVAYVYPALDDTTRTLRVRLPLANPDGALRPGMWASVRIFGGAVNNVLRIPREALIRTGQSTRVVLRDGPEYFVVREVVAGMESGDWIEIRSGVAEGEQVVVSGQFLIDSEAALRAGHGRLEGAGHQH